ncbi:hypothetical protein C8Q75DRAFT_750441 [Abortiporus biennis]|nr:hypothetical protein C8Q75DRAFT_750441 [Abortiporus biennis]
MIGDNRRSVSKPSTRTLIMKPLAQLCMSLLFSTVFTFATLVPANLQCRCLFGDACWPIATQFSDLASQVSFPLIQPIPPASPCYRSLNFSTNCNDVHLNWADGNWRAVKVAPYLERLIFSTPVLST